MKATCKLGKPKCKVVPPWDMINLVCITCKRATDQLFDLRQPEPAGQHSMYISLALLHSMTQQACVTHCVCRCGGAGGMQAVSVD